MRDNLKKLLQNILIIMIQAFVTVFVVEALYRQGFIETFHFLGESTRRFFYNFLLVFLLFAGLKVFNRKFFILFSFIITFVFLILGFGSRIKQEIRGEPILPTDLLLGSEAKNMLDFFSVSILTWLIIIIVIMVLMVGYLIYKIPNHKNRNIYQIVIPGFFLLLFGVVSTYEFYNQESFLKKELMVGKNPLDPRLTYEQNGVLAGFLMNLDALRSIEPDTYSKKTIDSILKEITETNYDNQEDQPDIIMIMNEAFWDPTVLDQVRFNKDPLPYFRELTRQHTSGSLLVPVFGGQTVNTEFEALTGMTTQILPYGSIPYISYLTKPISALPFILNNVGYESTMIHTYHNWFYQRDEVLQYLGFDQFVPIEFIESPVLTPTFYKDQTITDEIVKKLNQQSENPNFIFAVTTQNHGPYPVAETDKLENASIEVDLEGNKKFTKSAENGLEYFSDNLLEIDQEIQRLVELLENRDKKSILVFFGDHLPLLGDDYQVYREADYYNGDDSFEEYLKMHTTPFFIWDNFTDNNDDLTIGSNMLSPLILERAGIEGNPLMNFLLNLFDQDKMNVIPKEGFWDEIHLSKKIMERYELLQYDLLLGDMYSLKEHQMVTTNKKYRLGYGDPKISKVVKERENEEDLLAISGGNFSAVSEVYVNGEKVKKISSQNNKIIIPLVEENEEKLTIQITIKDSKGKRLSESNKYVFKNK